MSKRIVVIGIAAFILCFAGIALAKVVQLDLVPVSYIDPYASGQVVLIYAKGADNTVIQVNCSGLTPDREYHVLFRNNLVNIDRPFVAKKNGTITVYMEQDGDQSGGSVFVVISDGGSSPTYILKSSAE